MFNKKLFCSLVTLTTIFLSIPAHAKDYDVGQQDKDFTVKEITIKAGDSINFVNNDEIFHNVFSLSDSKMFDLGSFPKGDSRKVTFEEKGEVEVECAIHPDMKMKVKVE